MFLIEEIEVNFKDALKKRDATKVSVLRMLKAAIKNKEIDLRHKLDETEIISAVRAQIRQRREAIEEFQKAGRIDLKEKESAELEILSSYLPAHASREELEMEIRRIIEETGASGPKDMGKVMKAAVSKLAGKADGKTVSEIVKECLT
ncbi:MAG: GatB/YqeY domain-containing protein [Pseudomonadota bacterium]